MCAGMWVISSAFVLGCKSRSFISVSLIQRSFSLIFRILLRVFLFLRLFCRCFQLFNVDGPADRAPSSSFKYSSTYNRWKSWARDHGLTAFPAPPFHLGVYLRHLMSKAKTASPLESTVHSIAWIS